MYKISYGESRKAKRWKNALISWEDLVERLRVPFRTAETAAEYLKIKDRSDIKDKGGFVAGHVRNGLRRSTTVECRSMLTLDIDSAPEDFLNDFNPRYKAIVYSTHSHTPSKPRYRVIIPLSRDGGLGGKG